MNIPKLPDWTAGTTHISPVLLWKDGDGNLIDLSGATISGRIRDTNTNEARDIVGSIVPDPNQVTNMGQSPWSLDPNDVVAGELEVRFTATINGLLVSTFIANWFIEEAI